jgi:nitrate ABC transporter ATP-binding subunit
MAANTMLEISQVHKSFGSGPSRYYALADVNLKVAEGEFVTLIGHSGCGKSTLLNLIAGFEKPSYGAVIAGGKEVQGPGPERAVVFQSHSLLPWLSVLDNVKLAVETVSPELSPQERREEAARYVKLVHLEAHAHKRPNEISGGMKQRVGIARALATRPKMLLMDEPFGALDALTRGRMQDELLSIWEESRKTVVMITHDVDEAIFLSDRIVAMSNGPQASIAKVFKVDLPRPRSREQVIESMEYVELRKELLHDLIQTSHALAAA